MPTTIFPTWPHIVFAVIEPLTLLRSAAGFARSWTFKGSSPTKFQRYPHQPKQWMCIFTQLPSLSPINWRICTAS
ncbi:hypothetical protein BJY00DRAFT_281133 [Aspergillus carlsbadensis]|nr:hypothetical protein BJY00DRAFT_281133 [Aspergillus carlsbadensis]